MVINYYLFETVRLPWIWLTRGSIKLMVKQREGFFALQGCAREKVAVPQAELDLNVDTIGVVSVH